MLRKFCYLQAYASVLRPLCEAASPPVPPLSTVVGSRAIQALLALVHAGLDMSTTWLHASVEAGADVLHLLLRRMQQGSSPVNSDSSLLEADIDRRSTSVSLCSAVSSQVSTWSLVSTPVKTRITFRLLAAGAADAAAAAAAEAAAAQAAAAERLVQQEGLLSDLMQLASLGDSRAQLAGLSCLAMLACSPLSAEAIVEHASTGAVLAGCLSSGPSHIKKACLRAAGAIAQHTLEIKRDLAGEGRFMSALAEACLNAAYPEARELHADVSLSPISSHRIFKQLVKWWPVLY